MNVNGKKEKKKKRKNETARTTIRKMWNTAYLNHRQTMCISLSLSLFYFAGYPRALIALSWTFLEIGGEEKDPSVSAR